MKERKTRKTRIKTKVSDLRGWKQSDRVEERERKIENEGERDS